MKKKEFIGEIKREYNKTNSKNPLHYFKCTILKRHL